MVREEKKIAEELGLEDRMDMAPKSEAYVQLKDHKQNYRNNPTFRLVNTNKSEIGKVAKEILQDINQNIRIRFEFNQWRSTQDVINWFKDIKNKERGYFVQFDISEFYPSITEDLLKEAINWAKSKTNISEEDTKIIMAATNSLLYSEGKSWKKKNCQNLFDLTMGSFHGAEGCELVGLYLQYQLREINFDGGLYRDDGLGVCYGTRRQNENFKKEICDIFKKNNLKITAEVNLKVIDFLDITLDLERNTFKLYLKPNNTLLYVNKFSNHPPNIISNIPKSVNKRLSAISKDENQFQQSIPPYQTALDNAGYNFKLKYEAPAELPSHRRRQRKIIWFNPPFCKTVKTNIGKEFFKILKECFPPNNPLSKIFNRNTVKISYSCMPSVRKIISGHNKQILKLEETVPPCNCTLYDCEVEGRCLEKGLIYQVEVKQTQNGTSESYVGLTENTFKDRLTKHRSSINNAGYHRNSFSSHIWYLKRRKINFELEWRIIAKGKPYSPSTKNM